MATIEATAGSGAFHGPPDRLATDLRFGVLGPLVMTQGNRPVTVNAGKQRAVLALLLLRTQQVVPAEQLIAAVWGDRPPPSASRTLQSLVSRLRSTLSSMPGGPALTRAGSGYLLTVDPELVDLHRFRSLVAQADRAATSDPEAAAAALRIALDLWRGEALADVPRTTGIEAEVVRLEELRQAALVDRIEADLRSGRSHELLGDLYAMTAALPLRERFWEQLMLALYRSGRQADALAAFRNARDA